MRKTIKYTNEPVELKVVRDFLPPPEKFVLGEEDVTVTITLSRESVDFFKYYAKKQRSPYQKMIRKVLDYYVSHYRNA